MALFRVIYAETCETCKLGQGCHCLAPRPRRLGPIVGRIVHAYRGHGNCPKAKGFGTRCRETTCPRVEGEILELWVDARDPQAALKIARARYAQVPIHIERGLSDRTKKYLGSWEADLVGRGDPTQSSPGTPAVANGRRVGMAGG